MRYELKSIRIWSFLKVAFFINLIMGFLFGILYAMMLPVLAKIAGMIPGFSGDLGYIADSSFVILLIVMPIAFAIQSALFLTLIGVVVVSIFNLVARIVGGVQVDLDDVEPVAPPVVSPHPMASPQQVVPPPQVSQPEPVTPPSPQPSVPQPKPQPDPAPIPRRPDETPPAPDGPTAG